MNQNALDASPSEPPPDLPGPAQLQLVDALLDAFEQAEFEQLSQFYLGQPLDEIAGGENLREVASNLVAWAVRHDRVADLVSGALALNAGNSALQAFDRDIWKPWQAQKPSNGGGTRSLTDVGNHAPVRHRLLSFMRTPPGIATGLLAAIIVLVVLTFVLPKVVCLVTRTCEIQSPEVFLANAAARPQTGPAGESQFIVSAEFRLINATGMRIRFEAVPLDAVSHRPVAVPWPVSDPPQQTIEATSANDPGIVRITMDSPQEAGCIVVEVTAYDAEHDPLKSIQTWPFDVFDPGNLNCVFNAALTPANTVSSDS